MRTLKGLPTAGMERVAARFRALSEVSRLLLVQALQDGEQSVTQLVERTGLSQPNVSRHLTVLRHAGLVGRRRDGLSVLYRVVDEHLGELCSVVCKSVAAREKS